TSKKGGRLQDPARRSCCGRRRRGRRRWRWGWGGGRRGRRRGAIRGRFVEGHGRRRPVLHIDRRAVGDLPVEPLGRPHGNAHASVRGGVRRYGGRPVDGDAAVEVQRVVEAAQAALLPTANVLEHVV